VGLTVGLTVGLRVGAVLQHRPHLDGQRCDSFVQSHVPFLVKYDSSCPSDGMHSRSSVGECDGDAVGMDAQTPHM
jgi:hypothetical protein